MKAHDAKQSTLWQWLLPRFGAAGANGSGLEHALPGLIDNERFRDELQKEMMRSDRTASPLTLLIFGLQNDSFRRPVRERALTSLAEAVIESTRKTDVLGWYRDPEGLRIGAILHHTKPEHAQTVIAKVRSRFLDQVSAHLNGNSRLIDISCEIYGYPGERESDAGGPTQLWLFDEETLAGMGLGGDDDDDADGGLGGGDARREGPGGPHHDLPDAATGRVMHAQEVSVAPLPVWKRAIDIVGSGAGLVVLAPLFGLIALAIKLGSRGPVFFVQDRVGQFGKTFPCYKFRTMRSDFDVKIHEDYLHKLIAASVNSEASGHDTPMRKLDEVNPRITRIGRILRKSSMDELPQLINVLKGEMSLVGPRPCLPYEAQKYLRWHRRRFDAVPGITGLWQVKGKNKTTFKQMIRFDIHYIRNCSFFMDAKILAMTFPVVLAEIREVVAKRAERRKIEVKSGVHQEA